MDESFNKTNIEMKRKYSRELFAHVITVYVNVQLPTDFEI